MAFSFPPFGLRSAPRFPFPSHSLRGKFGSGTPKSIVAGQSPAHTHAPYLWEAKNTIGPRRARARNDMPSYGTVRRCPSYDRLVGEERRCPPLVFCPPRPFHLEPDAARLVLLPKLFWPTPSRCVSSLGASWGSTRTGTFWSAPPKPPPFCLREGGANLNQARTDGGRRRSVAPHRVDTPRVFGMRGHFRWCPPPFPSLVLPPPLCPPPPPPPKKSAWCGRGWPLPRCPPPPLRRYPVVGLFVLCEPSCTRGSTLPPRPRHPRACAPRSCAPFLVSMDLTPVSPPPAQPRPHAKPQLQEQHPNQRPNVCPQPHHRPPRQQHVRRALPLRVLHQGLRQRYVSLGVYPGERGWGGGKEGGASRRQFYPSLPSLSSSKQRKALGIEILVSIHALILSLISLSLPAPQRKASTPRWTASAWPRR